MRRLALLVAGGALWLFLAAIPVFADGGPHQMNYNNGSAGINADSCAGCHRIHSATYDGGYQLGTNSSVTHYVAGQDTNDFCLSCHSATGMGATTAVDTGLQYYSATGADSGGNTNTGTVLGALRGGGFVTARIGSDAASRTLTWQLSRGAMRSVVSNAKVPVSTTGPAPITSAHLDLSSTDAWHGTDIVWGNATGTSAGTNISATPMECTACHNPHGNGQYRILNPIPGDGSGPILEASAGVSVPDDTTNTGAGAQTRNYTVIQSESYTGSLTAAQVVGLTGYDALGGDYLHKTAVYSGTNLDHPNGVTMTYSSTSNGVTTTKTAAAFPTEITGWCVQCHTRYLSADRTVDSGNPFHYQHFDAALTSAALNHVDPATGAAAPKTNHPELGCTLCHVAHGSNASMAGIAGGTDFSGNVVYPDGTTYNPGDSRLLKVDNRGTCLECHDPTNGSALPGYPTPASGATVNQGPAVAFTP